MNRLSYLGGTTLYCLLRYYHQFAQIHHPSLLSSNMDHPKKGLKDGHVLLGMAETRVPHETLDFTIVESLKISHKLQNR